MCQEEENDETMGRYYKEFSLLGHSSAMATIIFKFVASLDKEMYLYGHVKIGHY